MNFLCFQRCSVLVPVFLVCFVSLCSYPQIEVKSILQLMMGVYFLVSQMTHWLVIQKCYYLLWTKRINNPQRNNNFILVRGQADNKVRANPGVPAFALFHCLHYRLTDFLYLVPVSFGRMLCPVQLTSCVFA